MVWSNRTLWDIIFSPRPLTDLIPCVNAIVKISLNLLWLIGKFSGPEMVKKWFLYERLVPSVPSAKSLTISLSFPAHQLYAHPPPPSPIQSAPPDGRALAFLVCPENLAFLSFPFFHMQGKKVVPYPSVPVKQSAPTPRVYST